MAREKFQTLTEQMFYVLLCLREECCGMDLMERIRLLTSGRVSVGPGTLYNLLEQFAAEGYIVETKCEGRRRSYVLTEKGEERLHGADERLPATFEGRRQAMRTDRWNKKRELNLYAFYDHTGLERHLEKMAANGWMLESVGTYALRYRRCEPKKLRFAVVYYPKTDSFCPDEPNHENLTFWDYCAGAGWQIVTQRDDTHIFYNEDLDAVPIETEAVVQVETMERAKKGYVLSNTITVACLLPTMLYLQVSQLRRDPVAFLADGYDLTMMLMIFVMILLFGVELLGYRLWLRKAKRNARELGIFTPTHSSRWLSFLRSIWIFVFWALMVIPLLFRSAGLCIVLVSTGVVLVPVGGAMLVGKQVWKRSVPPKKRRLILVLTVLCSVLLSVMLDDRRHDLRHIKRLV